MKLIGLAAPMQCGKDTIADYLVANHGFLKFSFSDALYREVRQAFAATPDEVPSANGEVKERATDALALCWCDDQDFVNRMVDLYLGVEPGNAEYVEFLHAPRSPRWLLQQWGTEYRRHQSPDYWIKQAEAFVTVFLERKRDGMLSEVAGLVNTSVRFANECAFIRRLNGEVWHIYRRVAEAKHLNTYVSEQRLPVEPGDKELYNNGSLEQLHTGVSLLLTTTTSFLALESPANEHAPAQ